MAGGGGDGKKCTYWRHISGRATGIYSEHSIGPWVPDLSSWVHTSGSFTETESRGRVVNTSNRCRGDSGILFGASVELSRRDPDGDKD